MALKKIRFVWGKPSFSEGRWYLALFHLQPTPDPQRPVPPGGVPAYWKGYLHHNLTVSARGLVLWGGAASVVCYFVGAALIWQRLTSGKSYNVISYADVALPSRWAELERLRGEGLAARGRERLRVGSFSEGFGLLRLAMDKNPGDFETRRQVAQVYVSLRLRHQARQILKTGLGYGYPGREYLRVLFSLAREGDQPDLWVDHCEEAGRVLAAVPVAERPVGDERWIEQETIAALIAAGRRSDALAFAVKHLPVNDSARRELGLVDLLESGKPGEAIMAARAWASEEPAAPEPLRLLVRGTRELGDFGAMDEGIARLRALNPTKPEALLYAVAQLQLAKRTDAASAALDEVIFRHGASVDLYKLLAPILAETGFVGGLARLERELGERGFSPTPLLWVRLQGHVRAHEWGEALASAEALRTTKRINLTEGQTAYLDTITRLANACLDSGGGAQAALVAIIADRPGTLRLYEVVLEALLAADRIESARQVLTLAEGPFPDARGLAKLRTRISAAAAARVVPARETPTAANNFQTFEAFRVAFDRLVAARDDGAALALLSATRRAQPGWLSAEAARLEALELPLRARGNDPLVLQLLVRAALGRDLRAPDELLRLAQALRAEGHTVNAALTVKEIIRHNPGASAALKQLSDWEPTAARRPVDVE